MKTIDVTQIVPRLKHPTIFENFDEIQPNHSIIIHNDHDPKPLYYQLIAERGQIFEWEYLQEGPEYWDVKITKLKVGEVSKTVGELVAEDYRKAEVFRKFGIDFCCGGKRSITDACTKNGINTEVLMAELQKVDKQSDGPKLNFDNWKLDFLVEYIINNHHSYVREAIPMLLELSQKVARVHGQNHPELIKVATITMELANELYSHMKDEEEILFPVVREMVKDDSQNKFSSVSETIEKMESEHEFAGSSIKSLRELTNDFTPPADGCTSYRVLFSKLEEFEKDLHQHVHLENNVLFPKAIDLQEKFIN